MSLLIDPYRFAAPASNPIADLLAVSHAGFDLTAEGFTDGTSISTLIDQTGNGRHATQGTGSKQPTARDLGTGTPLKVADFDGTDDFVQTAAWTALTQPTTILGLARNDDTSVSSSRYLWAGRDGSNRNDFLKTSNEWAFYSGSSVIKGATMDATTWHVHVAIYNGASSRLYRDGGTATTGNPGTHSLTGLTFGSYATGTINWDGPANFVAVYAGDLRAANLTLLNAAGAALRGRANAAGLTVGTWTDIT